MATITVATQEVKEINASKAIEACEKATKGPGVAPATKSAFKELAAVLRAMAS
jgi:HJR/Mrr/RecB family endonuclease